MRNWKNLLYTFLSAFILSLPWLFILPGWILFTGFVPLLLLEERISKNTNNENPLLFSNYLFICFFLWNLLSAWWLGYATITGLILFLFLNTILMTLVWHFYYLFKKRTGENLALLFLICLWISFEYLHLNWDMQLPGMTLGGSFGNQIKLIQWYEFTGILGGSTWILIINIILFKAIKHTLLLKRISISRLLILLGVIIIPVAVSYYLYNTCSEEGEKVKITVLQPNINPFTEKFGTMDSDQQLELLLNLIDSSQTPSKYIIGPETALPPLWEDSLAESSMVKKLLRRSESLNSIIVMGANTKKILSPDAKITNTTRNLSDSIQYEEYNSALCFNPKTPVRIYHKNILVSGVEKVPFARYFGFLRNLFFDLGGTSGGLGEGVPSNFYIKGETIVSPLICFESMFGEYLGKLISQGSELVFVITNDGWWKKSPGAELHFSYSRLRAIEMRRGIARSANTGFSGFINQRGDILKKSDWWKRETLSSELFYNQAITFYARHGDYIGRISVFTAAMLLLFFVAGIYRFKRLPVG